MLLRRRAEEILELVDKTERELMEQDEQVEGVVAIGCGDLRSVQKLPELIGLFMKSILWLPLTFIQLRQII